MPVALQVVQRLGSRGGETALRSTILTKHCPNVVSRTFYGWRIFSGVIWIRCSRARHPTTTWSAPSPLTSLSTCTVSTHFHLRYTNSSNSLLNTLCTTQPYVLCTTQHSPLETCINGTVHCWSDLAPQETLSNPISALFWDITHPIAVTIYRRFGITYRFFVKSAITI